MSDIWNRIRQLEGTTLNTLVFSKPFRVDKVFEHKVLVVPEDGIGRKRMVLRERIEHIALQDLEKDQLLGQIAREFPTSQNKSYIAALVFTASGSSGA